MVTYCPYCGRQTPTDAMLCPYCGKNISQNKTTPQTYPMYQMQQPKQKDSTKIILIVAVVIIAVFLVIIAIAATTYIYVSDSLEPTRTEIPPNISFVKNQDAGTLTVARADPSTVTWGEIHIIGSCDTTGLTGEIQAGQQITNCQGTIRITHISTNTLIGIYDFS